MTGPRLFIAILLMFCAPNAHTHDARPIYVQLTEISANVFNVLWKVPSSVGPGALPYPTLPAGCVAQREPAWQQSGVEYLGQQMFQCDAGLSGAVVGIEFPVINPSLSTLYKIRLANGEEHVRILEPDETDWAVPDSENRLAVAAEYTLLGIEHIWEGIDHLLFVACLLFIVRAPRRLLLTITGFTVAHSITLALSALDLVRIPTPPVEAVIALSVVFMAWEIVRANPTSFAHRYPVVVSTSFGLLHGFGFAAVLRSIGLPQTELPTALLFFNLGVEIGQILFILTLLFAFLILRSAWMAMLQPDKLRYANRLALVSSVGYLIGGVASYWLIDRIAGFWEVV